MRWFTAVLIVWSAGAQVRAPLPLVEPVQDKNFFLLSLIQRTEAARVAVRAEPVLARIAAEWRAAIGGDRAVDGLQFTDAQIQTSAGALRGLYSANGAVRRMVDGPLRDSGVLVRYQKESGAELLAHGWVDAARAMNRAVRVYGAGEAPRYPNIDAISFDAKSAGFARLLNVIGAVLAEDRDSADLFFEPMLRVTLALLDANHRDEAGRFEPLEGGENAAALRRVPSVEFARYPYSAIVVLGSGTDRENWALSPFGKLRLEVAARRFHDHKAPFLIVSGGYVLPNQTSHCEALEMKKVLMAQFGVPANAILIDPHARHTTTNLRNAAREMYRYGFPLQQKALITTDNLHTDTIVDAAFARRCVEEMGYVPVQMLGRVSPFDIEFLPSIEALQMDASDPLDP